MGRVSPLTASTSKLSIDEGSKENRNGIHMSAAFLVVSLLAIATAMVAVGLIVHFTAPKCMKCQERTTSETTATSPSVTVTSRAPPSQNVRLPTNVRPIHYAVTIAPYLYGANSSDFYFAGSVNINVNVTESITNIKLHTHRITFNSRDLSVYQENGIQLAVKGVIEEKEMQWQSITMEKPLTPGLYNIVLRRFKGPLRPDLRGLYLSSYSENSVTKYLATTQMQPTDARKAFPCFDEPALKATFSVSLIRREDFKSISNMPSKNVSVIPGTDWFPNASLVGTFVKEDFTTTPRMSTYLIAFIVSQFLNASKTSKGREYRNWARPEFSNLTDYAMAVVINITEYFEDFFKVSYPLPKMDQASVPDFDSGAMENWGLIIYRERLFVFDTRLDRTASKQSITEVISHELAHMWFGNLVTMLWWDDLWLNEGFASFVETLGVANLYPDWDIDAQFVSGSQANAFTVDSKGASHPIYVEVNHPDEINEIFDSITYNKGSTVLRMLYNSLGDTVFRGGLSKYLEKNRYSNTFHTELYKHLSQEASQTGAYVDVGEVMDRWIKQMGYPVVNCSHEGSDLLLSQQHFLSDPTQIPDPRYPSPFNFTWIIPITMVTKSNSSSWDRSNVSHLVQWMRLKSQKFPSHASSDWYLLNLRSTGFYRVNYDSNNWRALINQLISDHNVFTPHDRARLLDDSFTLASAGYISYNIPMEMTKYLKNETHLVPWQAALSKLSYIHSMLYRQSPEYGPFSAYMRTLLTPIYARVGLIPNNSLSHQSSQLHELTVSSACLYGVRQCELDVRRLFDALVQSNYSIHIIPDIRRRLLCEGIATSFVVVWDRLFSEIKLIEHPGIQNDILRGLGCSSEPWILNRYLTYALNGSMIRRQDATTVFESVTTNPSGLQIVWDFLRSRWSDIQEQMSSSFTPAYLVRNLGAFNSDQKLNEMKQFRIDNKGNLGRATRALDLAIETVQINILWMKQRMPEVSDWLNRNV